MSRAPSGRLIEQLRQALATAAPAAPMAGIEHELVVRRGDEHVDFRRVVRHLDELGPQLDPGDPNARRGSWGGVITADGREAEIATPPAPLAPGFSAALAAWVVAGRRQLAGALAGCWLEGYSTHVSVSVDDRRSLRIARRFTGRFSPAMMLLLDRGDSPGLLVRPRRHRLELCGEYVAGEQRQAAVVFAAGAVGAAAALPARRLPPGIDLAVVPAVERFGFYVDRCAGGTDLYAGGRAAVLRAGRRRMTGQQVLEEAWLVARPFAAAVAGPQEVALVDDAVAGRAPLPLEHPAEDDHAQPIDAPASPFGRVVERRYRAGATVEAVAATWDTTVLAVARGTDHRFLAVPSVLVAELHEALDAGDLDDLLAALLATPAQRLPSLRAGVGGDGFGVFGSIAGVHHMVPPERNLRTGRVGGGGPGSRGREEKGRDHQHQPRPRRAPALASGVAGLPRKVLVGGAVGLAVLVVAAIAGASMLGGGSDGDDQQVAVGPGADQGDDAGAGGEWPFGGTWELRLVDPALVEATGDLAGVPVVQERGGLLLEGGGASAWATTHTDQPLVCTPRCTWHKTAHGGIIVIAESEGGGWHWEDPATGDAPTEVCGYQAPSDAWEVELLGTDTFRWTATWSGGWGGGGGDDGCGGTSWLVTYDVIATRVGAGGEAGTTDGGSDLTGAGTSGAGGAAVETGVTPERGER